ncbi:MAG: hypothetical protein QGH41_08100, partial [Roseibacillus sp.]|nr:hypothetical protein [Roseibacillus sp.]
LFGRSGPQPRFHLGRNQIEFENLAGELSRLKEERGIEVLVAVLDEDMKFGLVSELEKVADQVGIEVILGGRFEMEKTGFRNLREDSSESEAEEDQDGAEE